MQVELDKNPLFSRVRWNQSRDYKGLDFRAYLTPNFYRSIQSGERFGLRDYLDLETNNQVFVINTPNPNSTGLFTRREIKEGQVSPEFPKGIYRRDAKASVFYWVGSKQVSQNYKLVLLNDLQLEQLTDGQELTIVQDLTLWLSQQLPNLSNMFRFDDTSSLGSILNSILDRFDYGNAIAFWVPNFVVTEDLTAVTGSTPSMGLIDSIGGIQTDKERSFLPFLVSGLGLATGSPVLIGSGFVLRYLESVRR